MTTEEEIKKLKKDNLHMNIVLTVALALVCIIAGIDKVIVTRLTEKTAEVAQKVGVDFQTKTNNIFGVWKSVTPR